MASARGRAGSNFKADEWSSREAMPTNVESSKTAPTPHDSSKTPKQRDGGWEDRLRRFGDARFVEVEWSERDSPSWPLPRTKSGAP
jgi:hypothetical protein